MHSLPPISIGFGVTDYTKAAAALGATESGQSDPQQPFKDLVAGINASGGLAGRKIIPVYFTADGTSTNYDTDEQAACASFTEDHHVEAVVVNTMDRDVLTKCLASRNVPLYDGDRFQRHPDADPKSREVPRRFAPSALSIDRMESFLIEESIARKWITKQDKLGVVTDSCEWSQWTYTHVLVPASQRYGFRLEQYVAFSCASGFGDAGSIVTGSQNAAFKLHADGATQIAYLSTGENVMHFAFSNAAQSQNWHPKYLVTSVAQAESQKAN